MKKTSIARLGLKRETLRQLDAEALQRVAGGGPSYGQWCSIQVCWTDWCETFDCTKVAPCHPK